MDEVKEIKREFIPDYQAMVQDHFDHMLGKKPLTVPRRHVEGKLIIASGEDAHEFIQ